MSSSERVRSKIPDFESVEEEAAFWDSHSLTEFEDELEPVELEVVLPLRHGITVSLESDAFHRLCAIAKKRDVSFIALAQAWVLDGLERAEAAEEAALDDRRVGAATSGTATRGGA